MSGSSHVVRVPDRVLARPPVGALPEPVPLRRMIGPSVILVRLTAEWGFALFWACWIGLTLQFFLNMEIERWTLVDRLGAGTG